jgi:hypothetical protein
MKGSPSLLTPGSISLEGPTEPEEGTTKKADEDLNAEAMLDAVLDAPPLPNDMKDEKETATGTSGVVSSPAAPVRQKPSPTKQNSATTKSKSTTKKSSVFDRLYQSHTASSRSLHAGTSTTTPNSGEKKMERNYARRTPHDLTPTKLKYDGSDKSKSTITTTTCRSPVKSPAAVPRSATGRQHSMEYSIRMKPLTKLYFISKFHPGVGLEPIEPIKLGYTFFQSFCDYENGAMDAEQVSKEIIVAFFKQDFPSGRHWQMKEPEIGPAPAPKSPSKRGTRGQGRGENTADGNGNNAVATADNESEAYLVSMSATYDWEDAYRVATARGIVRFKTGSDGNQEIRVENYAYHLTGDA